MKKDKATFLTEFIAIHNKILQEFIEETKLLMQNWKDNDAKKSIKSDCRDKKVPNWFIVANLVTKKRRILKLTYAMLEKIVKIAFTSRLY